MTGTRRPSARHEARRAAARAAGPEDRSTDRGTGPKARVETEDRPDEHGLTQWHPAVPGTLPACRPALASSGGGRC